MDSMERLAPTDQNIHMSQAQDQQSSFLRDNESATLKPSLHSSHGPQSNHLPQQHVMSPPQAPAIEPYPHTTTTTTTTTTSSLSPTFSSNKASTSSSSYSYSPPSYAFSQQHHNHDPSTLDFPDAPSAELAPLQPNAHEHSIGSLPSLASLTSGAAAAAAAATTTTTTIPQHSGGNSLRLGRFGGGGSGGVGHITRHTSYSPPPPKAWPTGNPYSAYYSSGSGGLYGYSSSAESPARMDTDSMSTGTTRGPLSPDTLGGAGGRASSVSLDDPDVRMAAEALGHLRAADGKSPSNKSTPLPTLSRDDFRSSLPPQEEPLLSLVLESGSVLARPINGTVSAYNTTKNASPGFIKVPVEYVETVVGSGLQRSGIEGGVRWFFRAKERTRHHQSQSDLEAAEGGSSSKRRKMDTSRSRQQQQQQQYGDEIDPYALSTDKDRRLSMSTVDTLPAYDDARSPEYTEDTAMTDSNHGGQSSAAAASSNRAAAWQSRLIMSTSGLSIAMSEESLRSLKYCLSWLKWANDKIAKVISALKETLERYDSCHQQGGAADKEEGGPTATRRELGERISKLRQEVVQTLQDVIGTVSKYAGGALPQNASALVRDHLTSLPRRVWRAQQNKQTTTTTTTTSGSSPRLEDLSSMTSSAAAAAPADQEGKEMREGAQRVLLMAVEGLEMMEQVSNVLNGTIESAEGWCDTFGRRRRDDTAAAASSSQQQQQQQQGGQPATVPFEGVGVDEDVRMEQ